MTKSPKLRWPDPNQKYVSKIICLAPCSPKSQIPFAISASDKVNIRLLETTYKPQMTASHRQDK